MAKSFYIKSYGCQMNIYDSDRMEEIMRSCGYEKTNSHESANAIILNTCHIREKASEKIYSELGYIARSKYQMRAKGEDMIVIVAGCVAQAEGEQIIARAPVVDMVVGTESYQDLPSLLDDFAKNQKPITHLDFKTVDKFDSIERRSFGSSMSAFVTIQEGCDKFCSFCVVPYTRGPEMSRTVESIMNEVKQLADNGAGEIVLLGQNVNAYHGTYKGNEVKLSFLMSEIAKISGVRRIRYITSHPINMTDDLIQSHAIEQVMPYLHLPIQSGSNSILKAMNRKHDRDLYFKIVEDVRKVRPDLVFSSDFIVAFPGETDKDFEDTLDLIEKVNFEAQCFSFTYSPRPGTPAENMNVVDSKVASERLQILQGLLHRQFLQHNQSMLGKRVDVLVEGKKSNKNGEMQLYGKTPQFKACHIPFINTDSSLLNILITEVKSNTLCGEL